VGVVHQSAKEGLSNGRVPYDLMPVLHRELARDDSRGTPVPVFNLTIPCSLLQGETCVSRNKGFFTSDTLQPAVSRLLNVLKKCENALSHKGYRPLSFEKNPCKPSDRFSGRRISVHQQF